VNSTRLPQLGNVVWAEVDDANGYRKARPAVVITATDAIALDHPIRLVAITTRIPAPLPEDHVLLPWDRQGKARSGLRKKCVAVASWQLEIPAERVQVVGMLPPAVIGELLTRVAALSNPPIPPPAGDQ
jgi:mRNA-degrading endonuclease toxin of MazEF toxin-antitoxin module